MSAQPEARHKLSTQPECPQCSIGQCEVVDSDEVDYSAHKGTVTIKRFYQCASCGKSFAMRIIASLDVQAVTYL